MDKRHKGEQMIAFLRKDGALLFYRVLSALLIWLFGVLVFIPIARTINPQTTTICSTIILVTLTAFLYQSVPLLKRMIDLFSLFPAEKYGPRIGLDDKGSQLVFRYAFYILVVLLVYLLYSPLLTNLHVAIDGIVLIIALILSFFLCIRIIDIIVSGYGSRTS